MLARSTLRSRHLVSFVLTRICFHTMCRYLSEQHDATTIGVMLGVAASRRGSMDALVSKMLFLHLPATHPTSFPEIELSPLVQVCIQLAHARYRHYGIGTHLFANIHGKHFFYPDLPACP